MTVAKYMTIVGNAVELAGMMPEISKLNITMESRMVISTNCNSRTACQTNILGDVLRKVNFSPLSGGRRKPSSVMKLIKTHGTRIQKRLVLSRRYSAKQTTPIDDSTHILSSIIHRRLCAIQRHVIGSNLYRAQHEFALEHDSAEILALVLSHRGALFRSAAADSVKAEEIIREISIKNYQ